MYKIAGLEAYEHLAKGIRAKTYRFPTKIEEGFRSGGLFPRLSPGFKIERGQKVFTIGSCFARNIEGVLQSFGLNVPVARFTLPEGELLHHGAPHILNEYNAGTILQRIESVLGGFAYLDEMGIEETAKGDLDLFLHIHAAPVARDRLLKRREQIAELYRELSKSDLLIITLGLVESWFDNEFYCYLNKAPSKKMAKQYPGRFEFHRFDADDVISRMDHAFDLLKNTSRQNVLLTVSPVPIEATFMSDNVIMANAYSKAALRVAAEVLSKRHSNVDYFPSYEMVMSHGAAGFLDDNVHVDPKIVSGVTEYMIGCYSDAEGRGIESAESLYRQFFEFLAHRDIAECRKIADRLLNEFPDKSFGHDTLGHCYSAEGDTVAAIAETEKALAMEPLSGGLNLRLGNLYLSAGDNVLANKFIRLSQLSFEDRRASIERWS